MTLYNPKLDYAKLWKQFIESRKQAEAKKVKDGVYNVRQAPSMDRVNRYEEQQLIKKESE